MDTVFGIKKDQTRVYLENGHQLPVTLVEVLPAIVVQVKTTEKDGYSALQLGLGQGKAKSVNKPILGHIKKAKKEAFLSLRELSLAGESEHKPGDEVKLIELLAEGDQVRVAGISKGTGFTGVVKRWNFKGGPRTHGQSDRPRSPGSIGQGTTPGRVYKGKHMAGRAGGARVMIKNLSVVKIDFEKNMVWVKGLIPGKPGSLVEIKKTGKKTRFSPVLEAGKPLSIETQAVKAKAEAKKEAREEKGPNEEPASPVVEKPSAASVEEKQA